MHVLLIAVPLIIQAGFIFFVAYWAGKKLRLAVAITLFDASSPVVLVTIVGVLVEVPVMLTLVMFANRTRHWFPERRC